MERRTLLRISGGLALLAGLIWAAWIYQAAVAQEERALAAQEAGGAFHQVLPEQSKRFLHDMEVYGGKANVMMYRFRNWLGELFQGRSLAIIVACLTLGVAGGCFYAAERRPTHDEEEVGDA